MEIRCSYKNCPHGGIIFDGDESVRDPKGSANRKNFHKDCYEQEQLRQEFRKSLCLKLGLKKPGPRIETEINRLLERGYTYRDLLNALYYFFDVLGKKDPTPIRNKSVWFLIYYSQSANAYYRELNQQKETIKEINETKKDEEIIVVPLPKKKVAKPKYNLDEM